MFSGKEAYNHLKKLSVEIGRRDSGTIYEKHAAEYIADHFKSLGLRTWMQEFDVDTGLATIEKLEVTAPYQEEINCKALPLAGATNNEGAEGDLIYLDTVAEEYITPDLNGKIIMTPGFLRKGLELFTKIRPAGIISVGRGLHQPVGHGWGTPSLRDKYGPMPIVNITLEDALKLLEKGAKRVHLTVVLDAKRVKSQNVCGELEGTLKPEEIVLVGGHYDSIPNGPGASDNAGGTAIVMELARVMKQHGSKRTIRFIAWGCEESGCVGSSSDVIRLKQESDNMKKQNPDAITELDKIKLVVNADVQGAIIGTNSAPSLGPVELASSVKLLAKELGTVFGGGESGGMSGGVYSSDGTSYSSIGIPSLNFIRGGSGGIHSIDDQIKYLSDNALALHGEFIELFLKRYVADAVSFPFEKIIPDDQKKAIDTFYRNRMAKPPGSS